MSKMTTCHCAGIRQYGMSVEIAPEEIRLQAPAENR